MDPSPSSLAGDTIFVGDHKSDYKQYPQWWDKYSILTGLLGLVYFGSVVLLQRLLGQTAEERSALVLVLSTLLIAALFTPLRRRIQNLIDRRFFRKKYGAQQILAQFARTTRDETDIHQLTTHLVEVVQETLQSQQITLWLKENLKSKT